MILPISRSAAQRLSTTSHHSPIMQNKWNCRRPVSVQQAVLLLLTFSTISVRPCHSSVSPFSCRTTKAAHSLSAAFVGCSTHSRTGSRHVCPTRRSQCRTMHSLPALTARMKLSNSPLQEETEESSRKMEMKKQSLFGDDDDVPIIFRGEEGDDMPAELWQDIESGKPSEWTIMKDLLGINIFTYLLAAAIVFFLGMNALLGPGWLGGALGLPGTGTFSEMSDSLPDILDLSESKYQL